MKTLNFTLDLIEGETFVITSVITLSENLEIPPNVTLIFQGGRFESDTEVEIIANKTALVAPIDVIFGKNIKATGKWNIDRAHPQWFEAGIAYRFGFAEDDVNYEYPSPEIVPDMADPINKAIKMIGSGEVYLIRGDYFVTSPIYLTVGVRLNGVAAQCDGTRDDIQLGSRILVAVKDKDEERRFKYSHLIYINSKEPGHTYQKWSHVWTAISNITLMSYPKEVLPPLRCIYAASGVTLDTVHWYNMVQAIEFMNIYSDAKVIRNCNFDPNPELPSVLIKTENEWDEYAFNLRGLGDALVFDNNHMGDGRPLLYISECGGGTINDNILNGDTKIVYSKAISFCNNHIENGGQLQISSSNVTTRGNFFEKSERPSVKIVMQEDGDERLDTTTQSSIVSMENDEFNFYGVQRYDDETLQQKEERIQSISDTDILIDHTSVLNITNLYRNDLLVGFGGNLPFGIKIATVEPNLDFQFNDYSYFASNKCSILKNEIIQANATFHNLNKTKLYWSQSVEWVNWLRDSGNYNYQYRIIWDPRRKIYKEINGKTIFDIYAYNPENTGNFIPLNKYGYGVLLVLGLENDEPNKDFIEQTYNCMLEIIRNKISSTGQIELRERVYIPLCGSKQLYDNGISICGYKWQPISALGSGLDDYADNHYDMYSYNGGRVECAVTMKPINLFGDWKKGDVIYNVGDDESWNSKIIK